MTRLFISPELILRLKRIDSKISKYLLNLKEVDDTDKDYINYLGISKDNPAFISYLDKNKIEKFKDPIKYSTFKFHDNCKIKFKRSAFKGEGIVGTTIQTHSSFPEYVDEFSEMEFDFQMASHHVPVDSIRNNIQSWEKFKEYILMYDLTNKMEYALGYIKYSNKTYIISQNLILEDKIEYIKPEEIINYRSFLWDADKRIHGASGKVSKRLIGKKYYDFFNDKDLETFVGIYKLEATKEIGPSGEYIYEELKGEKIRWGYHESNYIKIDGTLGNSCMKHTKCQPFFDIYCKNENQISLGCILKEGKVAARCILWFDKKNSKKLYDRIYAYSSNTDTILRAHLETLGYKSCYNKENPENLEMEIDNGWGVIEKWPYMDTFRYIKKNILYAKSRVGIKHDAILQNTDGGPVGSIPYRVSCPMCGRNIMSNELIPIEIGSNRGSSMCEHDSVLIPYISETQRVYTGDLFLDDYDILPYLRTDLKRTINNKLAHVSDIIRLENERGYIHKDDINSDKVVMDDYGNYHLKTSIEYARTYLEFNGTFYNLNGPSIVFYNNKKYHKDDPAFKLLQEEERKRKQIQENKKQKSHVTINEIRNLLQSGENKELKDFSQFIEYSESQMGLILGAFEEAIA